MRRGILGACAPLVLSLLLTMPSARAAVIYDTQDHGFNLVPNADDGTPGRPPGSRMGNTVTFAGTERALDTVMLQYGTYHPDGQPSPTQTITLSLYLPDGEDDVAGQNGNQPGTLIGARSIRTTQFNAPNSIPNTLTFNFGGLVVPDSVIAIVSSSLIGNSNTLTGFISSSDFEPNFGSNPHGDRLWFGEGPGTFFSDDFWARADGNNDPNISNNMTMLIQAHDVPEPAAAAASLLIGFGMLLLSRGRRPVRPAEPALRRSFRPDL
jgi:hypothetical protein